MQQDLFKINWERNKAHIELDLKTAEKILSPYTRDAIATLVLLSDGCINTNYKINFQTNHPPVVLRIYTRENEGLQYETAVNQLVRNKIPVPEIFYVNDSSTHYPLPYTITEYINGRLMREVIRQGNEKTIAECAYDAGKYLAQLRKIHFPVSGFLEKNLSVRPFTQDEELLPYLNMLLSSDIVRQALGTELTARVESLIQSNPHFIAQNTEATLVHGDYDPANMLVNETNDQCRISGILDWEFCFAGSYFFDIGLMLRYSHRLPPCYETHFIAAINDHSALLPADWKQRAKVTDLLCLLQLIHNDSAGKRINMRNDIISLIKHTLENWHSYAG